MKKKWTLLCFAFVCMLSLVACGENAQERDYNGMSYQELQDNAISTWEYIQGMDLDQMKLVLDTIDDMSEAEWTQTKEANEGLEEEVALVRSWINVSEQAGEFIDIDSFEVTATGKTTTTELYLNFEKRPVVLSVVYKNRDMTVESTTVDLVYTMGEKMQRALMNTVMGMGTVFLMLIIICAIISCFSYIPKIEAKIKAKKQGDVAPSVPVAAVAPQVEQEAVASAPDDQELVAAIAAAIAAYTGQATDDFIVRSIKRRS